MSTLPSLLPLEAKPLLSLLDRPEPQVLVVVGTGISWGATAEPRSTWRGLLLHGVNHLESSGIWSPRRAEAERTLIEESFAGRFILDEVLRRADSLSEAFEAPYGEPFADWLKVAIGTLHPRVGQTAALEGLRDLADAGALVMTTNYDDLLCQATGMPAVTWEEPEEFLRVVNRDRRGILHVHGHWQRPSSIVFGKKSYDRIVAATDLQDTVKGLWQQWHWLFVGCGSGLEDPNLGHLLQWGSERFGRAARTDFFFGKRGDAPAARSDEATSRVVVSYADHSKLPEFLGALTPGARSWPFERLTADSKRFRQPGESPLQSPFPSWQEYLAGSVPTFAADGEVERRLSSFGWAFVLEVASVGKTTLALRLATRPEQRDRPVFYLELRQTPSDEETFESDASAALRRLARPGTLLILDNAHHQPDLTTKLWEQWRDRPGGSCLLILATRMDKPMHVAGDNALLPLEHHLENPAIHLRPSPEDLGNIFLHVMSRFHSKKSVSLPSVPPSALTAWHRIFGSELGAFVAAVTERQAQLVRGDWDLPESAAAEWMFERHLKYLNPAELENAICLSVFGVQELELDVHQAALPHPDATKRLLTKGLVERIELAGGKWVRFGLREPGWGHLLLAAASPAPDARSIWVEAASKNLVLAMALNSRLERTGRRDDQRMLWEGLASRPERVVEQLFEAPFPYIGSFLTVAAAQGEDELVRASWAALAAQPQRLAELAFETPLHFVAAFLTTARSQGQQALANALWNALAANPDRLAELAFETQLNDVAAFLNTARSQGQQALANALWNALAANLGRLVERAFETQLNDLATFLSAAQDHGPRELANALWNALAANPGRLAERAFETHLHFVAAFLTTAQSQGQRTLANALWNALAANSGRLVERALETQLGDIAAFLNTARDYGQKELVDALWTGLAANPGRLVERAHRTPLNDVVTFLNTGQDHRQRELTADLWQALAAQPERIASRACAMPLEHLGGFFAALKSHRQDDLLTAIGVILCDDPARLIQTALKTPRRQLAAFLSQAPTNLATEIAARFELSDWIRSDFPDDHFSRQGTAGLALLLGALGREDLKEALLKDLLYRADSQDFANPAALIEITKLLSNIPPGAEDHLDQFIHSVCASSWIDESYRTASSFALARSLTTLALRQRPTVILTLWRESLGTRIAAELRSATRVQDAELSGVVQLLGASQLVGWQIPRPLISNLPLYRITNLLRKVLPHRAEANNVEAYQLQLWLGLRVVAALAPGNLYVEPAIVKRTLELWRTNLGESAVDPGSTTHRVNRSMVAWLERCARTRGFLLRNPEPLWVLTGFPRDPHSLVLP